MTVVLEPPQQGVTEVSARLTDGMYHYVTDPQYRALTELFLKAEQLARRDEDRRKLGLGDLRLLFETGRLVELARALCEDDDYARGSGRELLHLEGHNFTKHDLLWTLRQQISQFHCDNARAQH